ncbi:UNVERIFIED_CONTAM: hypothetical protein LK11_58225 [Mumia flava]
MLVATPLLGVGPFYRSVVLLLDHDEEGALGVVINQPLAADVAEVLPDWGSVATAPATVFSGGPVSPESALAVGVLASSHGVPPGWREMYDRVGLVDLDLPAAEVAAAVRGMRVFAGYAGWGPGQLEGEIEEGSWVVVDADENDLLSARPQDLWRAVLRRQSGDARMLSTYPDDPQLN